MTSKALCNMCVEMNRFIMRALERSEIPWDDVTRTHNLLLKCPNGCCDMFVRMENDKRLREAKRLDNEKEIEIRKNEERIKRCFSEVAQGGSDCGQAKKTHTEVQVLSPTPGYADSPREDSESECGQEGVQETRTEIAEEKEE